MAEASFIVQLTDAIGLTSGLSAMIWEQGNLLFFALLTLAGSMIFDLLEYVVRPDIAGSLPEDCNPPQQMLNGRNPHD